MKPFVTMRFTFILDLPPQWTESVQPGSVLQAPAVDHQPHCRRRGGWWKQPGGSGGAAVQSEIFSPSAVLPACPHQSLRTLLSDWLGLQAPAGYHHLRQPSAAQVKERLHVTTTAYCYCYSVIATHDHQQTTFFPAVSRPVYRTTFCMCLHAGLHYIQ